MKLAKSLVVGALLLLPLTTLHAQLFDKKVLTLEAANDRRRRGNRGKKRSATVVSQVK